MARTEEEALQELLNADQSISWSRVTAWVASVVTLVVVVALMIVTMRQIAQTDRDAFDAHLREARVQQALDSAREVQAISAEQFLSFGTPASFGSDPSLDAIFAEFAHARFVPIGALRTLRELATDSEATSNERALAKVILEINSLERWIAPLAESTSELTSDAHYVAALEGIPDSDQAPWPIVRRRLDAVAVSVSGANDGTCDLCAKLLWGDDVANVSAEDEPSFVDPKVSFGLAVWQAECLRKLPTLVEPEFASCDGEGSEESRREARAHGREVAEQRFREATRSFEIQSAGPDEKICGVLTSDQREAAGRRTLATHAARAYNGLAMSLVNHDAVTAEQLGAATEAIDRAICLRQEAQETRAQVAASRENLAVIAYREAWQAHDAGNEQDASKAFNRARCHAEVAVRDNPNLPWSWTILYLTNTARSSVFEEAPDCAEALEGADVTVSRQSRSRSGLWRRLTFFEYDAFAPEELPGLLPMFPSGRFNRTGYGDLATMLLDLREDHLALRDGTEAPWQVFMTSVVEPGGFRLPFF